MHEHVKTNDNQTYKTDAADMFRQLYHKYDEIIRL
jgi:hypothetical protein